MYATARIKGEIVRLGDPTQEVARGHRAQTSESQNRAETATPHNSPKPQKIDNHPRVIPKEVGTHPSKSIVRECHLS